MLQCSIQFSMVKSIVFTILLSLAFTSLVRSQTDGFASLFEGTTGGAGGPVVNVSTEVELLAAVAGNDPRIIRITRHIDLTGLIRTGSNKSILGGSADAGVSGSGFYINGQRNIIIRGLRIFKSVAPDDGVLIERSTNIWVDHNDFYSDRDSGKDFYDGLLDAKNGADFITVSWNRFHDHYKTNLLGHSDSNGGTDSGKLHITYHHNYFYNCQSRLPSLRFGTAHIYNNMYENITVSTINSRMGAQVLVENNVFVNVVKPITTNLDSAVEGFAVERNNDYGGSEPEITQEGSFTQAPYPYYLDALHNVAHFVRTNAGATISF